MTRISNIPISFALLDSRYVNVTGDTMTGALTVPTIIGGTGTTSDLTLQTTSGIGATGADMHFLVGNNGATEAITILNSGNVGIGTSVPGSLLELSSTAPTFRMSDTTATAKSLLVTTDANFTKFEESGGAASNLLVLDLANARVSIGGEPSGSTVPFQINSTGAPGFRIVRTGSPAANWEMSMPSGNFSFTDNQLGGTPFVIEQGAPTDAFYIKATSGNVGIGTTVPVGKLDIVTTATNDDPTYSVRQARIATTDATLTTLQTITIAASTTYLIEARVVARRTGGTAGTADDGAVYIIKGAYTTKAGTVTLLGALTIDHSAEDVAGYDATLTISGTNILVSVTGIADTNVTWHTTTMVQMVGT